MYIIKFKDGTVGIMTLVGDSKIENEIKKLNEGHEESIVQSYKKTNEDELPKSRNYRDAWSHDLSIDLSKAKEIQKTLIVQKAKERVTKDAFGTQDFSTIQTEFDNIDFDVIKTIDELYNAWPASIDQRSTKRKYLT